MYNFNLKIKQNFFCTKHLYVISFSSIYPTKTIQYELFKIDMYHKICSFLYQEFIILEALPLKLWTLVCILVPLPPRTLNIRNTHIYLCTSIGYLHGQPYSREYIHTVIPVGVNYIMCDKSVLWAFVNKCKHYNIPSYSWYGLDVLMIFSVGLLLGA